MKMNVKALVQLNAIAVGLLGGCCPVDAAAANPVGSCQYAGSSGQVGVGFQGATYLTPSCWEAEGDVDGGGLLTSDNIDFASATLGLSVEFFTNQENDTGEPVCNWEAGMVVPLTSNCLSLIATGTEAFIAAAGYQATSGTLAPTGSLTIVAWPAAYGDLLSITFSFDAELLYTPALNSGGAGDAGLLPISGAAASESTGPVESDDE
jgi:hypothetical protein